MLKRIPKPFSLLRLVDGPKSFCVCPPSQTPSKEIYFKFFWKEMLPVMDEPEAHAGHWQLVMSSSFSSFLYWVVHVRIQVTGEIVLSRFIRLSLSSQSQQISVTGLPPWHSVKGLLLSSLRFVSIFLAILNCLKWVSFPFVVSFAVNSFSNSVCLVILQKSESVFFWPFAFTLSSFHRFYE